MDDPGTKFGEVVVNHMRQEACRTLLFANLLGQGLPFAQDLDDVQFLSRRCREESQNYVAIGRLHEQLVETCLVPWVSQRCAVLQMPQPTSWVDVAIGHWLFERSTHWQMSEFTDCTWVPYQTLISRIVREKRGLQSRVERAAVDACNESDDKEMAQDSFVLWFSRLLPLFGRPDAEIEIFSKQAGIRRRNPVDVIEDFLEDIKPGCRMTGLELPPRERIDFPIPKTIDWSL